MNNTTVISCPVSSEVVVQMEFWLGGVVYTIVTLLGIIGNIVSIIVFTDRLMINCFNKLLMTLAFFDLFYLLFCVMECLSAICAEDFYGFQYGCMSRAWVIMYPYFLHPMQQLFWTASVYMTTAICVDRYFAIVHPLLVLRVCGSVKEEPSSSTREASTGSKSWIIPAVVLTIAILIALPHFFEFTIEEDPETGKLYLKNTKMRVGATYEALYSVFVLVFRVLIPLIIMILTNIRIVWVLKKSSSCKNIERSFAWTTVGIVIVFFVCSGFKFINNAFFVLDDSEHEIAHTVVYMMAKLSLSVNSSINFVLYCFVGDKFKNTLLRKICRRTPKRKASDNVFVMSGRNPSHGGTFIRHSELRRNTQA